MLSWHVSVQKNSIIELKQKLKDYRIKDTTQFKLLNDLAFAYKRKSIDSATYYNEKSYELAQSLRYKKGIANVYYIRGILAVFQFKNDVGLNNFKKALKVFEKEKDYIGEAKTLNAIGIAYIYKRELDNAIPYIKSCVSLNRKLEDKSSLINSLNTLGSVYSDKGNNEKALKYYLEALEIAKEIKEDLANLYLNLGVVYSDIGVKDLAIEYYYKSKAIYEEKKHIKGVSKCLNNLGIVYREQKDYDNAIICYEQAISNFEKIKDERNLASGYGNLGIVYKEKEDYEKALNYFNESVTRAKKIKDDLILSRTLGNIGELYIKKNNYEFAYLNLLEAERLKTNINDEVGLCHVKLGIAEVLLYEKRYEEALNYLNKTLVIIQEKDLIDLEKKANEQLANVYEKQGDFQKSYVFYKNYIVLKDSILNEKNLKKITALEYEYKYKKQISKAEESLKKSEEKWFLGIILFLAFLVVTIIVILFLIIRNIKKQNQKLLLEQRLLRSQMNPHFVFNALGVLQGMILQQEYKKAIQYLGKFSRLLRLILENSREKMVLLEKELSTINTYVTLQNLGVEIPFNYQLEIESSIDENSVLIPSMLLQPFVENAIEHGFRATDIDKNIILKLEKAEENLICIIEDNGVGINKTKEQKQSRAKKSLATIISEERVQIISKKYRIKAEIKIEDLSSYKSNGTRVTIVLPYKKIKK